MVESRILSMYSTMYSSNCVQLMKDLLFYLNEKNINEMQSNENSLISFKSNQTVVENIITICEIFKQSDSVKFSAIELFDRFMFNLIYHTREVYLSSSPNAYQWMQIENKLTKQMHLRAVTSVVIASKLYSCNSDIGLKQVKTFLDNCGYNYSIKSLIKSEKRVLQVMQYKLFINSFDIYVETLLSILNNNLLEFQSYFIKFFDISKYFVQFYYLSRDLINTKAFEIMVNENDVNEVEEQVEIDRIGSNRMLISCGIIAAIPIIIDISIFECIVNELSEITQIPDHFITSMGYAILYYIHQ